MRPLPDFKPVTPAELDWIEARKIGQLRLPAGAMLIEEGGRDERLYPLLVGWAFRFKTLADGRRQILNILLPGDLAGLQAELLDAAPHGVETITPVTLCAFRRDTVAALARDHANLAYDITWLAAHGERLVDDAVLSVGRRNATERLAALLVHLYKRAVSVGLGVDGGVPFPLTQAHLADTLGLSAVHVNRVLQRLRRDGLIRLADGRLHIGDLRALRRVAAYFEQPAPRRPLF
ncbi:Crp/Fnr family transcriptional regulator [Leptolyngbya sp. 15MV]|nr:Crp/Fnr family transcriptional regulator [Leptolyngbya sp. 15MV]